MSDLSLSEVARSPQYIARADEPMRSLRQQFEVEAIRSLIVLGDNGPVGAITRREFRSLSDEQLDDRVGDHVLETPVLAETMSMSEARELAQKSSFDAERLPIVNKEGQLIGEVMREDLIQDSPTHTAESAPIFVQKGGDAVTIKNGMQVRGGDGKKLGQVSELFVENERATEINVKRGLLGRRHKRIPAAVMQTIEENDVHLTIGQPEFQALADIEDNQ